jgi:hypothetical protein
VPSKANKKRYVPGAAPALREEEVVLPTQGTTLLLRAFSLKERNEWIAENASDGEDEGNEKSARERLAQEQELAVELVSRILVDPKLTAAELTDEVQSWPPEDFDALTKAAVGLIGFSEEALRSAEDSFRSGD